MKKFISAVTSLAMTVTMASSIAPSVSAADASKGFAIKAYAEAGSKYDAMGSKVTVSKDDIAAGDVVVPVAVIGVNPLAVNVPLSIFRVDVPLNLNA